MHREVLGPEGSSVLDTQCGDENEDKDTGDHVGNGEEWVDKWRGQETSDDGPIEGDWDETKTSDTAKNLVDNWVLWSNPAGEGEVGQELSDPSWEEIPDERSGKDVQEPPVASNGPAVGLRWVRWRVVMESVEQGCVDQVRWPDHGRWPDQETTDETCHTETYHLGGDDKQHLETPTEMLTIEFLLCQENISGIGNTTCKGGIGHDNDDSVLLHVEGVWVERPRVAEGVEGLPWHDEVPSLAERICHQLDDESSDLNGWIAKREEHIDATREGGQNHTDRPGANCVTWHILWKLCQHDSPLNSRKSLPS